MNTPQSRKAALPDPSYHWTTCKAQVFLGALADLADVTQAARVVGMSRQSAYRLRDRLGPDSLFAKVWDRALEEARARRLERRRAAQRATRLAPESDIFGIGK